GAATRDHRRSADARVAADVSRREKAGIAMDAGTVAGPHAGTHLAPDRLAVAGTVERVNGEFAQVTPVAQRIAVAAIDVRRAGRARLAHLVAEEEGSVITARGVDDE